MAAFCTVGLVVVSVPSSTSLKDKRSVIRGLVNAIGRGRNVAVAETGMKGSHKVAELTIAVVGDSPSYTDSELMRIVDGIGQDGSCEVTAFSIKAI